MYVCMYVCHIYWFHLVCQNRNSVLMKFLKRQTENQGKTISMQMSAFRSFEIVISILMASFLKTKQKLNLKKTIFFKQELELAL